MDSQIYKVSSRDKENSREVLPTMKYVIQVISKKSDLEYYNSKSGKNFLIDIKPGDIILLEYPPIMIHKYTGGVYAFSIKITNLSNNKYITIPCGKIESNFWNNLDEIKVIE